MVQRMLEEVSGKKPIARLSADESVAHGAAIYAGLVLAFGRWDSAPKFTVRNVNSHNLGVLGIETETDRPRNQVMIPRNTALPATQTARFVTASGQPAQRGRQRGRRRRCQWQRCHAYWTLRCHRLPPGLPVGTSRGGVV